MNSSHFSATPLVLTVCHMAGMIDMVALPLWVGTLMQHYAFSPPQAGLLVTLFLLAVVVASVSLASVFHALPLRTIATVGFAIAAGALFWAALQRVSNQGFAMLGALHALAGLGAGAALSVTHGSIGRSRNPHRLFGLANVALGILGIAFLGGVPVLQRVVGPQVLLFVMAALMFVAALTALLAFPVLSAEQTARPTSSRDRLPVAAWCGMGVVVSLALNQSLVFAFVERIGDARGFTTAQVGGVLVTLGFVNLLPGLLAAVLQNRLSPLWVGVAGPVGQALLAMVMTQTSQFAPYALAAALYVSMVIFTHTFLFGLLARLDSSGRAVAATPATMMLGASLGPALGGLLVSVFGYEGLGWAACAVALVAVLLMVKVRRSLTAIDSPLRPAPI